MWIVIGIIAALLVVIVIIAIGKGSSSDSHRGVFHVPSDQEQQEAFGKHGEHTVFQMVSKIAEENGGYAYENVAFKDDNGYSTEIDAILICSGGFFVIEVKSNKGIITGGLEDERWHAEKEPWQEDRNPHNPVKQNQGHINHLKRMAGKGFPYITSLVIFPYATNIDAVRSQIVHDYYSAQTFIRERIAEGKYKKATVDRFNEQLKAFRSRYGISHEEHMRCIHEKFEA
ncbi:MAG: nuclease-related domain-containing protein [Bacilli bacterium]|nr:nuclease-related domain-containing protein [Bacilli bacterium]